jgi:hypothetical protein
VRRFTPQKASPVFRHRGPAAVIGEPVARGQVDAYDVKTVLIRKRVLSKISAEILPDRGLNTSLLPLRTTPVSGRDFPAWPDSTHIHYHTRLDKVVDIKLDRDASVRQRAHLMD